MKHLRRAQLTRAVTSMDGSLRGSFVGSFDGPGYLAGPHSRYSDLFWFQGLDAEPDCPAGPAPGMVTFGGFMVWTSNLTALQAPTEGRVTRG